MQSGVLPERIGIWPTALRSVVIVKGGISKQCLTTHSSTVSHAQKVQLYRSMPSPYQLKRVLWTRNWFISMFESLSDQLFIRFSFHPKYQSGRRCVHTMQEWNIHSTRNTSRPQVLIELCCTFPTELIDAHHTKSRNALQVHDTSLPMQVEMELAYCVSSLLLLLRFGHLPFKRWTRHNSVLWKPHQSYLPKVSTRSRKQWNKTWCF